MKLTDTSRRWTQEIGRLRTRAARIRRRSGGTEQDDVIDESLSTCEAMLRDLRGAQLQLDTLRRSLDDSDAQWTQLFQQVPVPCIEVDAAGTILRANGAASVLFNTSSRHLENRPLVYFTAQRDAFSTLMRSLPTAHDEVRTSLLLRPRERATTGVEATIVPAPTDTGTWLWFFVPAGTQQRTRRAAPRASASTAS